MTKGNTGAQAPKTQLTEEQYNKIKGYIYSKAIQYDGQYGRNRDDWVSELNLRLCEKMVDFDPEKSSFTTWAINIINWYIGFQIRETCNRNKKATFLPLKEEILGEDDFEKVANRMRLEQVKNMIEREFSEEDAEIIFMLYFEGYDSVDVEKQFGKTRNQVRYLRRQFKEKIKALV